MNVKRLLAMSSLAGMMILAATAMPVQAGQGLHWFQGQTPTVTNNGTSVEASGQVAGAGTFITAVLTVHYTFPVSCFNPGSDTGPVPGHSGTGTTAGSQTVQAIHGNASFDITVPVPTNNTPPPHACPSSKWVAVVGTPTVSSATVTVNSSNGGFLSYTQTF
jgi:hypothetical protein